MMTFNQGHALIIGIGSYPQAPALNTASLTAQDAEQVAAVLRDPNFCGYPDGQVQLLCNADATRDSILSALDTLATRTDEGSTVFVFYSGHGEYGTDGYYLTTYDTQLQENKVAPGTGIRETELLEKLRTIKASRALLIFNACHSGQIAPALGGNTEPESEAPATGQNLPDEVTSALLGTGEGRIIITACRQQQKSYFLRKDPLTLFAQTLTDGLRGTGIQSRRGYISVFDLYDYLFSTVSSLVAQRWGLAQEPVLTISRGVGILAVALYHGTKPQGDLGPQDRPATLGGAVREIDEQESHAALQQILSGTGNMAAGGDITDNTFNYGDQRKINTGGDYAEGDMDKRQGIFGGTFDGPTIGGNMNGGTNIAGDQVNLGSGDYVRGNQDKRSGAFINGGTVYGPVTGNNSGTITTTYGSTSGSTASSPIQQAIAAVEQASAGARQRGNADTAEDLDGVLVSLHAALTAEQANNASRRTTKLQAAQSALRDLAAADPSLQSLLSTLLQVH